MREIRGHVFIYNEKIRQTHYLPRLVLVMQIQWDIATTFRKPQKHITYPVK